jgi:hypothetical protein
VELDAGFDEKAAGDEKGEVEEALDVPNAAEVLDDENSIGWELVVEVSF